MNADQITAFIALRLRDVASFNGCVGTRDGVCIEREPDNPVEWCKYCVQGQAARIIERHIEGRPACADQPWQPIAMYSLLKDMRRCQQENEKQVEVSREYVRRHVSENFNRDIERRHEVVAEAFKLCADSLEALLPAPPSPAAKETL